MVFKYRKVIIALIATLVTVFILFRMWLVAFDTL